MQRIQKDDVRRAALAMLSMQRQSWEHGVAMQAMLEWGEESMVARMAFEAVNRSLPDGRIAMLGAQDGVTDPCACGEALGFAARCTGNPALTEAYERLLAWALEGAPRSAEGVVYHLTGSRQFWVDSMYMLPPFLASAGHFREALVNLYGYWARLYDENAQLMCHMWDEETGKFLRSAHWGVGNGWALAALARIYDLLPDGRQADRERIACMGRNLTTGLLRHMRADGLFLDVVDAPDTFVETNLSQMVAYALFRGMASGWLQETHLQTARKLCAAAEAKLDAHGFVQGACGAPTFNRPGIAPEAQAFYVMMQRVKR